MLQSPETLSLYEEQLDRERRYLDKLAEELDRAEREYVDAIQAKADSLAAYTNAERAYQAAEAALETAKQPLQSADTPWSEAKTYVRPFEEAVDSAKKAVEESERAIDEKNRREAANAAVFSAEVEVYSAQNAVNATQAAVGSADPNSEGYADLLEALKKAQSNLEQAKNTLKAAESNPDRTLTPVEHAIDQYEARAAVLADCEAKLSSAKAACGYDTYKAAYIAAENAYNQANTAFKAAEKAYQEASDAYQSNDADASQKTAVCQDGRTMYYNQQVFVATLEKKVLSARAQADSDSTQTAALANQFETTKASILSQLRAELEQAEKTLNKTYITSSRDGVVAELPVSIGAMVEPGTEIVNLRG